ncbi:MAG: DUF5615 family PIN-like protein [Opitutaceae bacterium]|nr:DUF5615 family PIN-like protein [Opitutaceae bacterium]
MKIKLDENLPESLAVALRDRGHEVDTVADEGLQGHPDNDVWSAAQSEGRFLITQDLDFSDVRQFCPGTHAGLLLVRLNVPGRLALLQRIDALFATESVEQWQRCFVVVTDHKIRVRTVQR